VHSRHCSPDMQFESLTILYYYELLNQDNSFRQDLESLFSMLAEPARSFLAAAEATGLPASPRGITPSDELLARLPVDHAEYHHLDATILAQLRAFARRWPLPRGGSADLWYSLETTLHGGKPRLLPGVEVFYVPTPGLPIVIDIVPGDAEAGTSEVTVVEHQPWVVSNCPIPFLYDPLEHNRQWLAQRIDAICQDIRASIIAQAAEYERQLEEAGWRKPPPRYLARYGEKSYLRLLALRLYRRAVLKLPWDRIADLEVDEGDPVDARGADNMRKTVTPLARRLGIPLPRLQ